MTAERLDALKYAKENKVKFLEELIAFSAIPSISTDPEAKAAIENTAEWVAEKLTSLELQNIKIYPPAGAPYLHRESEREIAPDRHSRFSR